MELEHKAVKVDFKEQGQPGSFLARIATLGEVDKDGDITLPGAFPIPAKAVLVSAYMHGSWGGQLPVGKAIIREVANEVLAEGQFNLGTLSGKEHYEAVKFAGELQEWSYGFTPTEVGQETRDNKQVRLLKKVEPYEISPVLRGAGIDTGTLDIKADREPFGDQAERVLLDLDTFMGRAKALAAMRTKEGRVLSAANRERMTAMVNRMQEIMGDLRDMLDSTMPMQEEGGKALQKVFLEYQQLKSKFRLLTEVHGEDV